MPKDKISQYAFTPAANTDIGGINIDEGCAPSGINNAIRTLMTQIRDLQAGVSGDTIPLTAGGTGSGTAASARAALGLAIGTNVLGYVTPGASGNVLQSDGSNWTSVAATAVTLDTITGGPLALAKGGTNATTAAQARANLNAMQNYTAGATGQVLTSTGTGWVSQAASGGLSFRTRVLTSGTTYTPVSQVKSFYALVYGAAGGQNTANGKGGVGGPGYSETYYSSPSGSYSYSIGAGGTTSGTAGGTTTFGAMSITGSNGVTGNSGSTGGVGSGGTFNATGGTGGTGLGGTSAKGGGGGGAGSRAGNGGNGGNNTGSTGSGGGGGGTGGNNASGSTGGAAATVKAAGALDTSTTLGTMSETFDAGNNGTASNGGTGAEGGSSQDIINIWTNSSASGGTGGLATSGNTLTGASGKIVIIELF